MFIQAETSLERSSAGLGVGLSLARKLVELHGGSIRAESAGQGRGSTFTVTLPILAASSAAAAEQAPVQVAHRLYRILLADDNVDFVNGIGALLRSMGHQVHIAYDGQQALAAAEAFAPEFAFLDIGLPKLNGYDLARALQSLPALRHTVLVAVTGWGQQKDRQRAFEAGFHHHLVKPVSIDQLQEILAQSGP
jgi:CheY-like chemotaxis protein